MEKFTKEINKFYNFIYNHALMYDKKIRENCYNEICLLQNNGLKKCIFNQICFIYDNIFRIRCPHHLIDILVENCNYKNYNKIWNIKNVLYFNQINYKKKLMDFIFEKSKAIANKDDLVILFLKIRSSGSCCVTFYDELCKEYGLHLYKNIYIEN